MREQISSWLSAHGTLIIWTTGISAVMFFTTLLLIPLLVTRIPEDYFTGKHRQTEVLRRRKPFLIIVVLLLKNLLGVVFILAGIVMLFIPGQGILSILIGLTLCNFPGKYNLERKLISMPKVFHSINWLRGKSGKGPLNVPNKSTDDTGETP